MTITAKEILGFFSGASHGATVADIAARLEDFDTELELAEHFGILLGDEEEPSADELSPMLARGGARSALRSFPASMPFADAYEAI